MRYKIQHRYQDSGWQDTDCESDSLERAFVLGRKMASNSIAYGMVCIVDTECREVIKTWAAGETAADYPGPVWLDYQIQQQNRDGEWINCTSLILSQSLDDMQAHLARYAEQNPNILYRAIDFGTRKVIETQAHLRPVAEPAEQPRTLKIAIEQATMEWAAKQGVEVPNRFRFPQTFKGLVHDYLGSL